MLGVPVGWAAVLLAGCGGRGVLVPPGYSPTSVGIGDARATEALGPDRPPDVAPTPAAPSDPKGKTPFQLPQTLPGVEAPPVPQLKFDKDTPAVEREKQVREAFPRLPAPPATRLGNGEPLTLTVLQQTAMQNSPVLRRTRADAEVAFGNAQQAGLHPNPTVGYQADQIQPGNKPKPLNNAGQHGGFVNQLIKTAHKLSLAEAVSGYDYLNAVVAARRSEVDVSTAVRTAYFTALVARQSMEVNGSLAELADEVYKLQLRQVAGGEAAGYEPLQLYAQAVQARNASTQAEASYKAAWRQLAAAVAQPDLPLGALAGRAETPAPEADFDSLRERMLENHTDILTAKNSLLQARTNLTLQRRIPIPDLATNSYYQYDNVAQNFQFGVQLGIQIPISDRNQGAVFAATATIARATENVGAVRNDLSGRLGEAMGRYESARATATNYRTKIIPALTTSYRALIRRYQVDDPGKVQFNDIVVAQQNLATALQSWLTALGIQWQSVVDIGALTQQDDLFATEK